MVSCFCVLLQKTYVDAKQKLPVCQFSAMKSESKERFLFFFSRRLCDVSQIDIHFEEWIQLPNLWYIKLNIRSLTPAEQHYYLRMPIECYDIHISHTISKEKYMSNNKKKMNVSQDKERKRCCMWSWWKMRTEYTLLWTVLFLLVKM